MSLQYEFANLPGSFSFAAGTLSKAIQDVPVVEWLRRPNESTNHLLWIVGHTAVTRGMALRLLGVTWADPWPGLFGRGAALVDADKYPPVKDVVAAWDDVSRLLPEALSNATQEMLSAPPPPGVPTFDGKVSGVLTFLAFHEMYHVGQVGYLRRWLGHSQVVG